MNIFISYRRNDTSQISHQIHEFLEGMYGKDQVFIDDENILFGKRIFEEIRLNIECAEVMLLMIGRNWLSKYQNGNYLLDNPEDPIRLELEWARMLEVKIIPVLVDGLRMKDLKPLPNSVRFVENLRGVELSAQMRLRDQLMKLVDFLNITVPQGGRSPLPPITLKQGLNPYQRVEHFEGQTGFPPLSPDAIIYFRQDIHQEWWVHIHFQANPETDIEWDPMTMPILRDLPIQEVLGRFLDWYRARPTQFRYRIEELQERNFFSRLFDGKRTKPNDEWKKYYRSDIYYIDLHLIIQDFEFNSADGLINFHYGISEGEELNPMTKSIGYFGPSGKRIFGKYIMTLTFDAGDRALEEEQVYYFPQVSGSKFKYFDARVAPFFGGNVKRLGHVGLGPFGYHIAYLWV